MNAELLKLAKEWRKIAKQNSSVARLEKDRFGKFSMSLESYAAGLKMCARQLEKFAAEGGAN